MNPETGLDGLKEFQQKTVEYAFRRMYLDPDYTRRFLVADETGLGRVPNDHASWVSQYMWSLGIAIAGGTANIQRNVIAERGLGLPRDAAANRSSGK